MFFVLFWKCEIFKYSPGKINALKLKLAYLGTSSGIGCLYLSAIGLLLWWIHTLSSSYANISLTDILDGVWMIRSIVQPDGRARYTWEP